MEPASDAKTTIDWVHRILKEERDIVIASRPLEATGFQVENIRIAYVFYESGLSINVMYTIDDPKKRAVGFKLSEGMDIPDGARLAVQVRPPEVEARRHHPRLLLRDQERALTLGQLEGRRRVRPQPREPVARRDHGGQAQAVLQGNSVQVRLLLSPERDDGHRSTSLRPEDRGTLIPGPSTPGPSVFDHPYLGDRSQTLSGPEGVAAALAREAVATFGRDPVAAQLNEAARGDERAVQERARQLAGEAAYYRSLLADGVGHQPLGRIDGPEWAETEERHREVLEEIRWRAAEHANRVAARESESPGVRARIAERNAALNVARAQPHDTDVFGVWLAACAWFGATFVMWTLGPVIGTSAAHVLSWGVFILTLIGFGVFALNRVSQRSLAKTLQRQINDDQRRLGCGDPRCKPCYPAGW